MATLSEKLQINFGTEILTATLENNPTTVELINKLQDQEITIKMREFNKTEKMGDLPFSLESKKELVRGQPCDINLMDSSSLVILHEPRAYNFTRIGTLDMCTQNMLKDLLKVGKGTSDIKISVAKVQEEVVEVEEKHQGSILEFNDKLRDLKAAIKSLECVAVAFSGGVDSSFLLKIAHECLGRKAYAITVHNEFTNEDELEEAKQFCKENEINQLLLNVKSLSAQTKDNPEDRCYYCKKEVFSALKRFAQTKQIPYVLNGSDADSKNKFALKAVEELGIKSPLRELGFTNAEVREFSKAMGIKNCDKHYAGCLATRFAFNEEITLEKIHMIQKGEFVLKKIGCSEYRVRLHNDVARIEVNPVDFPKIIKYRVPLVQKFKEYGFNYVSMDIQGFRSGSMKEALKKDVVTPTEN